MNSTSLDINHAALLIVYGQNQKSGFLLPCWNRQISPQARISRSFVWTEASCSAESPASAKMSCVLSWSSSKLPLNWPGLCPRRLNC